MEFIFDIETSGLPKKRKNNIDAYESARIVSLAWFLVEPISKNIIQQEYYLIKPDGFSIPTEATRIHNIEDSFAKEHGIPIAVMLNRLEETLKRTDKIISYNINFDYNVLNSELIRYDKTDMIEEFAKKKQQCVMLMSQKYLKHPTFPKLSFAYQSILNKNIQDAHNAHADTISCYEIYKVLCKQNTF